MEIAICEDNKFNTFNRSSVKAFVEMLFSK